MKPVPVSKTAVTPLDGRPVVNQTPAAPPSSTVGSGQGLSIDDLFGQGSDIDGERNDYVCSDGVDNDGDGLTDCEDIGCKFDASVTVCSSNSGMRFSIVAGVSAGYYKTTEYEFITDEVTGEVTDEAMLIGTPEEAVQGSPDVKFERLQLRVMGSIPLIQDSFFLISGRGDKDFRVSFAFFQMPNRK